MKLCKDCDHYKEKALTYSCIGNGISEEWTTVNYCMVPLEEATHDLVVGQTLTKIQRLCYDERDEKAGATTDRCGSQGKYWSANKDDTQ